MNVHHSFILNNQLFENSIDFKRHIDLLPQIPENIAFELNEKKAYQVKSKVKPETFKDFLTFWSSGREPEFTIDNISDYYLLSKEFGLLKYELTKSGKNDLLELSILQHIDNSQLYDRSPHEEQIAKNLDKFISTYPNQLQKIPINSLYNIFNHTEKCLLDQNKAYNFIIEASNQNQNFFILLESLEETQLNPQIMLESLLKIKQHFGFHPKILTSSFLSSITKEASIDEIKKLKTENQQLIKEKVLIQEKYEDTIYALKEQIQQLKQENQKLKQENQKLTKENQNFQNEINQQQCQKLIENKEHFSINDFNLLSLKEQQNYLSKVLSNQSFWSKTSINSIIPNSNNLLQFLINLQILKDDSNCFKITIYNIKQPFENLINKSYNMIPLIILLSNAVETLFYNNMLNSSKFINHLKHFEENVSFEIKYPFINFNEIYNTTLNLRKTKIPQLKIVIAISDIQKTDLTFKNNNEIMYLNLKTVNEIAERSFFGCSCLFQVSISDNVTLIDSYAFCVCLSLKHIKLPSSLISIGSHAFEGCSSLEKIIIPDSVTFIGNYAFYSCKMLKSITLSSSIQSIEDSTFAECSLLKQISIPDLVTSIGESAFSECKSLIEISIPNSVKFVKKRCFYYCSSLEKVLISQSISSLEDSTFEGCSSLKDIVIPESVTSIGNNVFTGCKIHVKLPTDKSI